MEKENHHLYISVDTLRNRITSRLIPILFVGLLVSLVVSLTRIPITGFLPVMILQIILTLVITFLVFIRKRVRSDTSALVMVGILITILFAGVATFGLLSATFVLAPIISLYLMLLGHRKSAYASIAVIFAFLALMALLFASGTVESAALPSIYVRSPAAWALMITAVGGASVAFVAPFELVPGTLEGSEERFRLAFENASVGVCITSLEGRLLKVNETLSSILGYSREELEQLNVSDITYKEDLELSFDFIRSAPAGGQSSITMEKRYVHKSGEIIWANVASSLIRDSLHRPQYFITHIQNITNHKRAEEELREREAHYRTLIDNTPDIIAGFDRDGRYLFVNSSIAKASKLKPEEFIGKKMHEVGFSEEQTRFRGDAIRKVFDTHTPFETEFAFEGVGGKAVYDWRVYPVLDSDENVLSVFSISRNITERKLSEDALRSSMEQLHTLTTRLENVREEERKSISREVHDELGQVLTALRMDLMSLKKAGATSEKVVEQKVESMLELTASATKTVQTISARLRPGMLDDLGLVAAIEWQMEDFEKRSGIHCGVNLPDSVLLLDNQRSTALFRILQETLTNVARHAQARNVIVSLTDSPDEVILRVNDDGIGIPDGRVNDPTSYGLLGIRERLHQYEGSCTIQKGESGGTEVTIQLPKRLFASGLQ